jgi:hypothetical protein
MKKNFSITPLQGFSFFIKRPELWPRSLFTSFCVYFIFFGFLLALTLFFWPKNTEVISSLKDIYKALAIAQALSLLAWFFLLSFLYNLTILPLLEKVAKQEQQSSRQFSNYQKVKITCHVVLKNAFWRLFWLFVVVLVAFFLGPISLVVCQIGMVHVALLDGAILTSKIDKQIQCQSRLKCAFGALIGGVVAFLSIPTLIVWIFWLPSLYVGSYLDLTQGVSHAQ